MSEEKFTKGDWKYKEGNKTYSVYYPHGYLCMMPIIKVNEIRKENESWLKMRQRTEKNRADALIEAKANAHLISAAPDMYEALWAMIELHQADFGCKGLDEPAIDKACSALAKARGDV